MDILLGKVISLQEGILKVRNILSINKEIQLTRAVKDFFDLLLFESEETTSEEIVDEEILSDYDIIGNIRCGRTNRLDERVIDQVKTGMRSLLQIPGTQLTGDMFDVNKAIMRCLVKNLAMFGLGLYVYAGEDLPDDVVQPVDDSQKPTKQKAATTPKPEQPPVPCICARCNQPIKRVKLKDGTIMQAAEFAATHEGMCADCYKATRFNVA